MRRERILLILGILYCLLHVSVADWQNEARLNAGKLSRSVDEFVEKVLGAKNLQDYYDTLDFKHRKLDGNDIAIKMANNLGQKIFDRNLVAKNLQKVVRNSLTSSNELKECCLLDEMLMEFDDRFKQKVETEGCYRSSETQQSSTNRVYLSKQFTEASKENLRRMPFLRWQYFASETGITTIHPGLKVGDCTSYDGRFRPFYVQANVPEPKDVVLVIDKSGSMNRPYSAPGTRTTNSLMSIAKDAAKTVVSTLNPHDRVAVVSFSTTASVMGEDNEKESCFAKELARPTSENVDSITRFIQDITAAGNTYYGKALDRAFDFFDSTAESSNKAKDRVLLFLSDGQPTDGADSILNTLKKRNAKLNHTVTVMTYGLGSADFTVLRSMANEGGTLYGEFAEPGLFTHVSTPSNLRYSMGSYYSFFSSRTSHSSLEPIWSLPYLDKFGLGVMMSVTLPVKDNSGNLAGVVATDLTMDDFLSDAVYFRPSKLSYVFVIDALGYVIYHPLFKYPTDHDVKYVDISTFERGPEMAEVIESMKKGGNGSKSFESEKITPGGSNGFYGVNGVWVTTNVFWRQIPHSKFSLCVVLTYSDEESSMPRLNPQTGDDFLYHRLDLVPPKTPCRHFNNYGAMDQTSMSIGPRGFANTDSYIYNKETAKDVTSLRDYMLKGSGGSTVKSGVRDSVWATQETERFWKNNPNATFDKFVMWRYVGTREGGIRIYPGTQLPKEFDSTVRPWYLNGLANRGKAAFTLPYRDASSGEYVTSISKAVFEGKSGGVHAIFEDEVVAVVSADILTQYVDDLLKSSYDMCFRDAVGGEYNCKLVDTAGFILFDNKKIRSSDSPEHITEVEPDIALSLLNANLMEHSECLIAEDAQEQRTYRITGTTFHDGTSDNCNPFTFSPIQWTNVYMIVRTPMPFTCRRAYCRCSSVALQHRTCTSASKDCECPCKIQSEFFNTCTSKFNVSSTLGELPKPCVPGPNPLSSVGRNEENIQNLPKCNIHSYDPPMPTRNPSDTTNASAKSVNIPAIVGGCIAAVVFIVIILIRNGCKKLKRKQSDQSRLPQATMSTSSTQPVPTAPSFDATAYKFSNGEQNINSVSYNEQPPYPHPAQPAYAPPTQQSAPYPPPYSPSDYYFQPGTKYPQ